ncbi:hypothetical protein [Streptomyces sp. TBY4]|uniref:hypothetical protein n=1 Tax=Streptomyces sp. TBY4 TaxID=2962030 RepID=UPI0020B74E5F|nr:hypothetical protein [Streptomyces sp. TBY4]MCP3759652.1 hypothetical protein [Streptomyces sp. TBY4]
MTPYKMGDRVSVLYLSTTCGTWLAYNRYVLEVAPDPTYGQRVWVEMPDNCAGGPILEMPAHSDFLNAMEAEPITSQTPGLLEANLNWRVAMAAPDSEVPSWPSGVHVPVTPRERSTHAARAVLLMEQLRTCDPAAYSRWKTKLDAKITLLEGGR